MKGTHQVVLVVAHPGGVPSHAVHCQQQVEKCKGGVEPQQRITEKIKCKSHYKMSLLYILEHYILDKLKV